ncbi:Zinc finger, BED-type predicted domain-containing protein [Strongyloides ratti]|uniref:Zinc finger, BED-type predicted domain-containing protein n=1 Tax=Strongyloides ratti TaxID=34506 RepID=A0A090LK37_STRRB|nr:Zinc finger, BED-type predicted domain-containing protein [Strongyloides ratti]CEF70152.1 Zinc finger, BED-type predicted domain-containing protein [Strongyloides ratti]
MENAKNMETVFRQNHLLSIILNDLQETKNMDSLALTSTFFYKLINRIEKRKKVYDEDCLYRIHIFNKNGKEYFLVCNYNRHLPLRFYNFDEEIIYLQQLPKDFLRYDNEVIIIIDDQLDNISEEDVEKFVTKLSKFIDNLFNLFINANMLTFALSMPGVRSFVIGRIINQLKSNKIEKIKLIGEDIFQKFDDRKSLLFDDIFCNLPNMKELKISGYIFNRNKKNWNDNKNLLNNIFKSLSNKNNCLLNFENIECNTGNEFFKRLLKLAKKYNIQYNAIMMVSLANNDTKNIIINDNFDPTNISNSIYNLLNKTPIKSDDNTDEITDTDKKKKTLGDLYTKLNDDISVDETCSTNSVDTMEHHDQCDSESPIDKGNNDDSQNAASCNRPAGRKKTHAVWNFFKDLKDVDPEANGAMCLHCDWKGIEKGPNNLKIHLKKSHTEDGIYSQYCDAVAKTPTQPYSKRKRNTDIGDSNGKNPKVAKTNNIDSLNFLSLFDSITGNPNGEDEQENETSLKMPLFDNLQKAFNLDALTVGESQNLNPLWLAASINQQTLLNNIINIKKDGVGSCQGQSDDNYLSIFPILAKDLNLMMTYIYNNYHEFTFSSKSLNRSSDGINKTIKVKDINNELKMYLTEDGILQEIGTFEKVDKNQLMWAVRVKMQAILFN